MADNRRHSPRLQQLITKFNQVEASSPVLPKQSSQSPGYLLGFTDSLGSVYEDSLTSMADNSQVTNSTNMNITQQIIEALQNPKVAATQILLINEAVKSALEDHHLKFLKPLETKCAELDGRIKPLEEKYTVIEKRLAELEDNLKTGQASTERLVKEECTRTNQAVSMTQTGRANNVVITGLKPEANEDLTQIISNLANKLNITLGHFTAARLGKNEGYRPIKVSCTSYWDKRKLYSARLGLKDAGFNQTFINEDLSRAQVDLFYHARKAKTQGLTESAWTENGSVFIRVRGSTAQLIPSLERLKQIVPGYVPPAPSQERKTTAERKDKPSQAQTPNSDIPAASTSTE
jgi:hypothetical protein